MKVAGYIRVSTGTQVRKGQGLRVQRDLIKKYCKSHKLDLVRIYEDKGMSGAKANEENLTIDREGLQECSLTFPPWRLNDPGIEQVQAVALGSGQGDWLSAALMFGSA